MYVLTPTTAGRRAGGFTLIEMMITVVVIAILAGVAFPSFMGSIRKGRRSEAFAALSAVQQAQERWRANNAAYATNLAASAPTGLGLSATTPGGYYTVAIASADATSYELTATAVSGKSQANDTDCGKLGVKLTGGNLTYAGASASGTLSYSATHKCWSR